MTAKEYLSNASIYEMQAIEILKQQGNIMLLCKVEHKDGDIRWTAKTYKDAMNNLTNYPWNNPGYQRMTGYYKIIETMPI